MSALATPEVAPAEVSPAIDQAATAASRISDRWVFPAVWVLSAAYLWYSAFRGWIPHDEGGTGQAAERVLAGQLPHRDFIDVYTGGLAYLHAFAFRVLGIGVLAPRAVLLLFAVLWIPAVYWIVRRCCGSLASAGLTFVALAWGPPTYFAAVPSWYNLIFATVAGAALVRYTEAGGWHWLAAAGLAAGLSILAKLTGVFLFAAGLLYLTYIEAEKRAGLDGEGDQGSIAYPVVVTGLAVMFLALLWRSLSLLSGVAVLYHLFLPAALITGWIVWRQWRVRPASFWTAMRPVMAAVGVFTTAAAVPLSLFLLLYLQAGAVVDLWRGVFVLPFRRLEYAAVAPPSVLYSVLLTLPLVGVLSLPRLTRVRWSIAALVAMMILALPAILPSAYRYIFLAAHAAVPVIAAGGAALLTLRLRDGGVRPAARHRAVLLLLLMGLCGLVQFPIAGPVYFCHIAPLVVLTAAAVLGLLPAPPRAALGALALVAGGFASLWLNTGYVRVLGERYTPRNTTATLALPRGGIAVSPADSALYDRLFALVQSHARGPFIYAGPDAPQIYFLTGHLNPTPDLYDFFQDAATHDVRVLSAIDSRRVNLAVLNLRPDFSPPPSRALLRELARRFPRATMLGPYLVAWRP